MRKIAILATSLLAVTALPVRSAPLGNICADPIILGAMMNEMNSFTRWKMVGFGVVDLTDVSTIAVDLKNGTIACHMTAEFTNSSVVTGVYSLRKNSVGDDISRWRADR